MTTNGILYLLENIVISISISLITTFIYNHLKNKQNAKQKRRPKTSRNKKTEQLHSEQGRNPSLNSNPEAYQQSKLNQ